MHKIFMLHGMGNHSPAWAKAVILQIKAQYDEYCFSRDLPFEKNFEFIPLSYNRIFDQYLDEWRKNAEQLEKWDKLRVSSINNFVEEMTKLAKTNPNNNFETTHIGDVLLYLLTNIRELVKDEVLLQITKNLRESASEGWSIISHSLGTRVMTDALQGFYTTQNFNASVYGKARVVMTVANVSYLLQRLSQDLRSDETGDVYHNAVFPSSRAGEGVCRHFINVAHELDPFLFVWPFNPPADFGNGSGRVFDRALYEDIQLRARDLTGTDPHDLAHYFRHPDVHQALFQALVDPGGSSIFSEKEIQREREDYYDETLKERGKLEKAKDFLQSLKHKDHTEFRDVLERWKEYGKNI